MTELTEILHQQEPISPEQAGRITASWPALLTSQIKTDDECREIERAVVALREPARASWIMARVAALLSQYYAADVPAAAVAMMAEDWLEELRDYPQWAITKSVRWWKSSDNPDRKKKPFEGDIAARAKFYMGVVYVASKAASDHQRSEAYRAANASQPVEPQETPEEREASRARMAAYAAKNGFKPKTFGGDA